MTWLDTSPRSVFREGQEQLLALTGPTAVPPVVTWQRIDESAEAFDERVGAARAILPSHVLLLAACGPRMGRLSIEGVRFCELPPKLLHLLNPARTLDDGGKPRSRVAYGGRGGAKSWAFARGLILHGLALKKRIMCGREFMQSIAESVHKLLTDQIAELGLGAWFEIQNTSIVASNGSEWIFTGLRANPEKIKSTEGLDIVWLEEAERISAESWQVLLPTVRKPGSEIWATWNPNAASDPTYQRYVTAPPANALVIKVGWQDNPWFPAVLDDERTYLARVDPDAYQHIWEGEVRAASDAQIFRNKYSIEAFEPIVTPKEGETAWDGPYLGADWGFAQDPSTLVKTWIHERKLYIEFEVYAVGCDIDRTPALFDQVPDARRHVIRADSARPETISYMQRNGYSRITGVEKWSGSVEDGIARLRGFEQIVIHPRCVHAIEEARLYSYKTDRLTGDIKSEPADKHNHIWDAVRYAIQPLIRRSGFGFLGFIENEMAEMNKHKGVTA